MHRNQLLELLENYKPWNEIEAIHLKNAKNFIKNTPPCFERNNLAGHVTGSAWIVSPDYKQVLLNHHKKLNMWMQFGGHCDGNSNILEVAEQENLEETGLKSTKLAQEQPFDIGVRYVPKYKDIEEHLHFDVTFLFTADPEEKLKPSDESIKIQWIKVEDLYNYVSKKVVSTSQMVEKTQELAKIRP